MLRILLYSVILRKKKVFTNYIIIFLHKNNLQFFGIIDPGVFKVFY